MGFCLEHDRLLIELRAVMVQLLVARDERPYVVAIAASVLMQFEPHLKDWKPGDPTWKGGKGSGLIGALNYLAGKGLNAL